MSSDPSTAPYQPAPMPAQPTNAAGLTGFIISLCGFACAIGFPIGLIVSLFGLRSEPKGFAIAGTVIGAIGTVLIVIVFAIYGAMFAACIGMGAAASQMLEKQIQTDNAINEAKSRIDVFNTANDRLPDEAEGDELISDLTDGWGNALRYELMGDTYDIRSAGSDGEFDTFDDRTTMDASFGSDDDADDSEFDTDVTPEEESDVSDEAPADTDGL